MAPRTTFPGADEFVPPHADLAALASAAAGCRGCDLYEPATQTVFGRGAGDAQLMFVGEQPGDVEDIEGEAFIGPAGRVLERALGDAGLADTPSYTTNAVKHFSFVQRGKRRLHQTPRAGHIAACKPWLRAEVAAVRPRLIVCLGSTAVKSLLGNDVKVMRDRGAILDIGDSAVGPGAFLVTVHPSSILRALPDQRDAAYDSFVADLRVGAEALPGLASQPLS